MRTCTLSDGGTSACEGRALASRSCLGHAVGHGAGCLHLNAERQPLPLGQFSASTQAPFSKRLSREDFAYSVASFENAVWKAPASPSSGRQEEVTSEFVTIRDFSLILLRFKGWFCSGFSPDHLVAWLI